MVASWPADRAAIELLTLDPTEVAKIINHCTTSVGGNVLSAIVTDQPARTRKILDIVMVDRAGQLLDHMSSAAAANALALPPVAGAALRLAEADISTVVGVLTEMTPRSAAQLVQAMDEAHAVDALDGMLDPARAADILSHIFPASRKQALLNRLSSPFRDLVSKHLQRTSDPDTSAG
jgi:Mg/Co/Ni transporter MgtE